jgi:spore maturation protein CgeB
MKPIPSKLFECSSSDKSIYTTIHHDGEFFVVTVNGKDFSGEVVYLELEEAERAALEFTGNDVQMKHA